MTWAELNTLDAVALRNISMSELINVSLVEAATVNHEQQFNHHRPITPATPPAEPSASQTTLDHTAWFITK